MTATQPAYNLSHDYKQLGDTTADAHVVEFPGSDFPFWLSTTAYHPLPDIIYFEAHFRALRRSDFPITDSGIPVMSKRMVEVLSSVGPLPRHRLIDVIMLDDTKEPHFDSDGKLCAGVADDRFVCVYLQEFTDAFDWERSKFERNARLPDRVKRIEKLVLATPPGGLPPLFRMSAAPSALLVSAEARRALDAAGIQGCVFESLDTISS